jgi:hypothetical protein
MSVQADGVTESRVARGDRVRRALLIAGALLLVAGLFDAASGHRWSPATTTWPVDFDINVVAARRLVDRAPLYDPVAARKEAMRTISPSMRLTGRDPFSSYLGLPAVALTHVPFLAFGHRGAVTWFRLFTLLEMIAAVVLCAHALSRRARAPALLAGLGALLWCDPIVRSLGLGQGNGLVMLALALAIWGASRNRWGVVGVGLGVATVLKVSPVLLVVYLLLRGRRRAVWSAAATVAGALALSAALGRPGDLWAWIRDVGPAASKGTVSAWNQSLVGYLARLTTPLVDLTSRRPPGGWQLVAYVVWGVAVLGLWRLRRGRAVDPLELGALVLVLLVAGPLSWDHYFAWAILPLVLLADPGRWERLGTAERIAVGAASVSALWLLHAPVRIPGASAVADDWWLRVGTGPYTLAAALLLLATVWLIARAPVDRSSRTRVPDRQGAQWPDDLGSAATRAGGGAPLGDPCGLVATGVHRRR